MKKYIVPTLLVIVYTAILVKIMVFKEMPLIRIGSLMLNFGGTEAGHPANFVPFKTIVPYVFGSKGLIIAGINLVGNVALLVPIGLFTPFIYQAMTWKVSLALAVAYGLMIELAQVVLRVGIFDIDDVILNALGVMIGFWMFTLFAQWVRGRKYKHIAIAVVILAVVPLVLLYAIYPKDPRPVNRGTGAHESTRFTSQ